MAFDEARTTICRYLQDAIAAERNFESQLKGFSSEGNDDQARSLFAQHAEETRLQHERLTARLQELGESPSAVKSFVAHMFGMAPKTAQLGHDESERVTQNLMIGCAAESAEVAMYECLAVCCARAGDTQTEQLCREIQQQERAAWDKCRTALPEAARRAAMKMVSEEGPQDLMRRYLEDVVAAENNFESILGAFSKMGEQGRVQELFAVLSPRAKSQHERLTARLKTLGGSKSTGKSILAHLLGFAPGTAQIGQPDQEKNTQNLMMCCAAAAAEMAMYESLAITAQICGDAETERLARTLRQEEAEDYEMTWPLLRPSALKAFEASTGIRTDAA